MEEKDQLGGECGVLSIDAAAGRPLSVAVEPAEAEMVVIHVHDGNAAHPNGEGEDVTAAGSLEDDNVDAEAEAEEASSPSSVSSRLENESECEEDLKRNEELAKTAKETELSPTKVDQVSHAQVASKLSAASTKHTSAAKHVSTHTPASAPAPLPLPAPAPAAAPIPLPPFFSLAFWKVYFSKCLGQHGNAHVLGHRKPLHLLYTFIGATLGIGLLGFLNYNIFMEIDVQANGVFLIGSFGASATLLYGAPTADFSQPRNVWGGHVVSALCGLIIGEIIPDSDTNYQTLRAAFAVAFAIVAMNVTHTVHPPGGATALIAVTPSASIQHLHWLYLVLPVAIGAAIMILVAILVNNCAQSRHYPKYWI